MLAVDDGGLFIWSKAGSAQIRHKDGSWTPVLHVAGGDVHKVIADQAGVLLERNTAQKEEAILLGLDGKRKDSWVTDAEDPVSGLSQEGLRWIVTRKTLIPLLPGSKLGPPEPLPTSFTSRIRQVSYPPFPAPDVLSYKNSRLLLCLPRDVFMEGYGEGVCERTGSAGWRVPNSYQWLGGTTLCGTWIVHVSAGRLAVRSAETGRVAAEKRFPAQPHIACAGPDKLVVGEKTLDLLLLPSLKPVIQRKTRKGPVTDVAFLGDEVAFSQERGTGIDVLSVSCAMGEHHR